MISVENKITIKKAIEKHPIEAKKLVKNPSEKDIEHFAGLCQLDPVFINHNLSQIRYWI